MAKHSNQKSFKQPADLTITKSQFYWRNLMETDTRIYHYFIRMVWVEMIWKTEFISKVARPSTFIPENHNLLKLYGRAFVDTPIFQSILRCIFEYSFGVTPSESHYTITYQKEYNKNLQDAMLLHPSPSCKITACNHGNKKEMQNASSSGTEVTTLHYRILRHQHAGKDQNTHKPEQVCEMFILSI